MESLILINILKIDNKIHISNNMSQPQAAQTNNFVYQMEQDKSEIESGQDGNLLKRNVVEEDEKIISMGDNPQATIQINPPLRNQSQKNSSKILLKQKDRYQNKTIQRGMFNTIQESSDELKIIYSNSSQMKKQESTQSLKKRRPLKLAPLQNSSGVKLITQQQLNKNSKNYEIIQSISKRPMKVTPIRVKQITSISQFVKQSLPVNKKFIGILKRNRAGSKRFFPQYDLFLNQQVKFIMNSKRKPFFRTSTYHLGTSQQPVDETSQSYAATLKSNFSGSEFNLYDASNGQIQMLATITYSNQLSCQETPRSLDIYILSPYFSYSDLAGADRNMNLNLKDLYELGENKQNNKIIKLTNKKPIWDADKEIFCLDFHGKARYSSVKNMILVDADDESKQAMILAKAGDDVFNMDIMFPLSPRIALAIASSSFDFKWISQ